MTTKEESARFTIELLRANEHYDAELRSTLARALADPRLAAATVEQPAAEKTLDDFCREADVLLADAKRACDESKRITAADLAITVGPAPLAPPPAPARCCYCKGVLQTRCPMRPPGFGCDTLAGQPAACVASREQPADKGESKCTTAQTAEKPATATERTTIPDATKTASIASVDPSRTTETSTSTTEPPAPASHPSNGERDRVVWFAESKEFAGLWWRDIEDPNSPSPGQAHTRDPLLARQWNSLEACVKWCDSRVGGWGLWKPTEHIFITVPAPPPERAGMPERATVVAYAAEWVDDGSSDIDVAPRFGAVCLAHNVRGLTREAEFQKFPLVLVADYDALRAYCVEQQAEIERLTRVANEACAENVGRQREFNRAEAEKARADALALVADEARERINDLKDELSAYQSESLTEALNRETAEKAIAIAERDALATKLAELTAEQERTSSARDVQQDRACKCGGVIGDVLRVLGEPAGTDVVEAVRRVKAENTLAVSSARAALARWQTEVAK